MVPLPVNVPLPAEMLCVASLAQRMHPDDLALMEHTVMWRREPHFPRMGRSAWIRLSHPFELRSGDDSQHIRSLKVKGVGLLDHQGGIHRPSTQAYRRPDAHLGFDEDGEFCELWSAPAPMGGLTLNRAIVEYATASELCTAGPISEVPFFVYRYTNMDGFHDDSGGICDLAVMVAGMSAETPVRGDNLVNYARQASVIQVALRDWAQVHSGHDQFDWVVAQLALWRCYGKRLREFHECGFYRHNSNPCNLGLGQHGVFLVDLDSTRHLLECSPRMRALQVLRDVAGAMFHLIDATIRSREAESIERAIEINGATIDAFLGSYFPDVSDHTFESAKGEALSITSELWRSWSAGAGEAGELESPADGEYRKFMTERHSHHSRGIDGPTLFSRLMPGLAVPYAESRVAYRGGSVTAAEVGRAAGKFLSRRPGSAASIVKPRAWPEINGVAGMLNSFW